MTRTEPLEPSLRRQTRIIGAVTLLGLALRLWGLADESFWQDEAWSWWTVRDGPAEALRRTAEWDLHPPLYYFFLSVWSWFGESEFWLRLPSALFGAASIPLLFRIAHRLLGWNAAVAASLLLAFGSNPTYFSQEARSYSLLTFEILIAANLVESEFRGREYALGAVLGLIGLTHYVGPFFAAVIAFWMVVRGERKKLVAAGAVAAGVFALWTPSFIRQLSRADAGFWIPPPTPREIWNCILEYAQFPHYPPSWGVRISGIVLLAAAVAGAWCSRRRPAGRVLGMWAAAPIVLSLVLSLRLSIFYARSFVYVLPAWLLLASSLPRRALPPVTALLALAFLHGQILLRVKTQKEDWRSATAVTSKLPEAAVAFWPGDLEAAGQYYLRFRSPSFALPADGYAAGAHPRENFERLLSDEGPSRVWLFTRHGRKHVAAADLARFQRRYDLTTTSGPFNGVLIELWSRRAQYYGR